MPHQPVLLKETVDLLRPEPGQNFIDATMGEGGHARAILKMNRPDGLLLGIEADPEIYRLLSERMQGESRLVLVNDSYIHLKQIVREQKFQRIRGILFDLGMCSWHVDESKRGFSYLRDEPLDMRFNSQGSLTAAEIVNFWGEQEIAKILREWGEERFAHRIARAITESRKQKRIVSTGQLTDILKQTLPKSYGRQKTHFAARTFQALRIAVNDELSAVEQGIRQALEVLEPGGRMAVISFHSLEDRIVKNFWREKFRSGELKILTKKPIRPGAAEINENLRARSAKLRAAEKI